MRTCLNMVTVQQGLDPIEGVRLASEAGFQSVGIWADSFEAKDDPTQYAADFAFACEQSDISVAEMCFVGGWMWAEGEERRNALDQIRARAELAAATTCPLIIACGAGGTGDVQAAADDFSEICEIGRGVGVSFAFEYIGMFEQVKNLRSGLEVVRLADHPNGKLLIDTFHTFRGGSTLDDFDLPKGDEVGLIHINDAPAGDIMQMADSDRVMPGDGAFPLREALGKLAANGYDGGLSVEVFSEDWWGRPHAETAKAAAEGLAKVMG